MENMRTWNYKKIHSFVFVNMWQLIRSKTKLPIQLLQVIITSGPQEPHLNSMQSDPVPGERSTFDNVRTKKHYSFGTSTTLAQMVLREMVAVQKTSTRSPRYGIFVC